MNSPKRERFYYVNEIPIDKPFNWPLMVRLLSYIKPYTKKLLPLTLVAMLISTGVRLFSPYLISLAIDQALVDKNSTLLLQFVILIGSLYLLSWLANTYRIRWMQTLGQSMICGNTYLITFSAYPTASLTNVLQDPYWFGSPMTLTLYKNY